MTTATVQPTVADRLVGTATMIIAACGIAAEGSMLFLMYFRDANGTKPVSNSQLDEAVESFERHLAEFRDRLPAFDGFKSRTKRYVKKASERLPRFHFPDLPKSDYYYNPNK